MLPEILLSGGNPPLRKYGGPLPEKGGITITIQLLPSFFFLFTDSPRPRLCNHRSLYLSQKYDKNTFSLYTSNFGFSGIFYRISDINTSSCSATRVLAPDDRFSWDSEIISCSVELSSLGFCDFFLK